MTFDRFKEVSKIYIDKLKTNHNYVKVGAFLFLTIKFAGAIHAFSQGHFSEHIVRDSLYAGAFGIAGYLTYHKVKRDLSSKEFLEKKELADKNYQEYRDVEDIYDEKKKLEKIIAPIHPNNASPVLNASTILSGADVNIDVAKEIKPKKNKI